MKLPGLRTEPGHAFINQVGVGQAPREMGREQGTVRMGREKWAQSKKPRKRRLLARDNQWNGFVERVSPEAFYVQPDVVHTSGKSIHVDTF